MSTVIKVAALQHTDLFELPNGSVYETARRTIRCKRTSGVPIPRIRVHSRLP